MTCISIERHRRMMLIDSFVAPSQIEGVGIFASQPVRQGQAIWRFDPLFDIMLTRRQLECLTHVQRAYVERYGYPHMRRPGVTVLESDNGRFMNHDDDPNTVFTDPDIGYARRDIAAGEELTCDYGEFDPAFRMMPGRLFVGETRVLLNGSVGDDRPLQP